MRRPLDVPLTDSAARPATDGSALLHHYTLSEDDIEQIQVRLGGHNRLGFALRIGHQGEIRDRSIEGRQYRMAGLNLLSAIVIHWNTVHLGEASRQRNHAGLTVEPELLAHILHTDEYRWPQCH